MEELRCLANAEATYHALTDKKAGKDRSQTSLGKTKRVSPTTVEWASSKGKPSSLRPKWGANPNDPHFFGGSSPFDTEHDLKYPVPWTPPLSLYNHDGPAVQTPQPGRQDFHERLLQSFFSSDTETDVTVHMDLGIMDFLERELNTSDSLLDLVVITGDEAQPWATTCGDYISYVWPRSSRQLHSLVTRLQNLAFKFITSLESPTDTQTDDEISMGPALGQMSCITSNGLNFLLEGTPLRLCDALETLAWLLSVLQTSPDESVHKSRVCMENISTPLMTAFRFSTFTQSLSASPSSCWRVLVPKAVTAGEFPVPNRKAPIDGLEISFDLLCYLCGLEYEVVEDGGVVLYGERSIVYPVRYLGDSVEWHFEARNPLAAGNVAMDMPGARLRVHDLQALREGKRHFLGLWANPRITLGTSASDCSNITWSRAAEIMEERIRDGLVVGGTLVGPKVLNLNLNKTYKIARSRKNMYMADFEAKMHSLIGAPIILYSPSERRAWMVPFTNVILHLARGRAQYQQALGIEIAGCQLAANGGQAAFEVIQTYCSNPFRRPTLEGDEEKRRAAIQGYINEVWMALDCATRATYRVKDLFRTQIVGYEMADIARVRTLFRMKRHQLELFTTGWNPLLDEVHLALFYEGLPDPIVPIIDESVNSPCALSLWRSLPHGHDLLAATLPCLRHVSEHLNSEGVVEQVTRQHWWHCPGCRNVFSMCENTSLHVCNRLQELKTNDWRSREEIRGPNQDDLRRYPHGVVCFRYRDSINMIERPLNPPAYDVEAGQNPRTLEPIPARDGMTRRQSWTPDSGYSSGQRPACNSEQEPESVGPSLSQERITISTNVQDRPSRDTESGLPQAENSLPARQNTSQLPHHCIPMPQARAHGTRPARSRLLRQRISHPQSCVIL